jgi:NADH-quinone oxidoreductase subunit N
MNYADLLKLAAPECVIVAASLLVLAFDRLWLRDLPLQMRATICTLVAATGCVGAIAWMVALPQGPSAVSGMLVVTPLTQFVKIALLALTLCAVLLARDHAFTAHTGEYFALMLLGAAGMMFLVSSDDLLMIFVSLELTSLSLYILTAFDKTGPRSAEAAMKYFLFGGTAAAFTLYGFSLIYGCSGFTSLKEIAATIQGGQRLDPLLLLGIVLATAGFGFKVAAAPFHLWAPDAYQGGPIPSAALIASASKVAGFFVLARFTTIGLAGAEGSLGQPEWAAGWIPLLGLLAVLSMLVGNLAALVQSSVRRLLAYSAVAHAGYALLAIMAHDEAGMASLLYYVITYAIAALGAFGVAGLVQNASGGEKLTDFAGLVRRMPLVSLCMGVFILSLAGIPPLSGFFAKFYVFASVLRQGPDGAVLWLVVLAVGMSAVSLYYYLQILKQIFVFDAPGVTGGRRVPVATSILLAILALATIVLGCVPGSLVSNILQALQRSGP